MDRGVDGKDEKGRKDERKEGRKERRTDKKRLKFERKEGKGGEQAWEKGNHLRHTASFDVRPNAVSLTPWKATRGRKGRRRGMMMMMMRRREGGGGGMRLMRFVGIMGRKCGKGQKGEKDGGKEE
jgi:hypothetical protein